MGVIYAILTLKVASWLHKRCVPLPRGCLHESVVFQLHVDPPISVLKLIVDADEWQLLMSSDKYAETYAMRDVLWCNIIITAIVMKWLFASF